MTVGTRPDVDLDTQPIDQLAVNTIRVLAMDAVQAANSGHPGTPMALAPVGYMLWTRFLRFDPELPVWANRDRFVLSAGHASTLLYALLHLSGVKSVNPDYETVGTPAVTLDDLRRFRQLDSKCPGHPEYRWTSGVECTTGPLGTGIATSVGMAIAGLWHEVGMTVAAYEQLTADGIRARVVSMPSMELFDKQPPAYREEVLPAAVTARVAVEKASPFGWDRWVGTTGVVIGMSTFGESAPMKVLQAKFGFTTENIVATARAQLGLDHAAPEGTTLEPAEG